MSGVVSGRLRPGASDGIDSTLSGKSRVRLDDLRALVPLLQQAGVALPPPIDDRISGSLDAWLEPRGTIAAPRMLATLSGRAIRVADFPAGDLDSTLTIDRRAVQARSLEARLGTTRLVASGEYTWQGQIDMKFAATADDLDALARAFEATGVVVAGSAAARRLSAGRRSIAACAGHISRRISSLSTTPQSAR